MTPALALSLRRYGFGLAILVVLLIANVVMNPARFHPAAWGTLLGMAAPLIGAALASAPVIMAGRGGIDISVGPAMGLVNAVVILLFVHGGIASPWLLWPVALLLGAGIGAINGFLATVVRIQPIVATLGTYLILTGLTLTILPAPLGPAPGWLRSLSGVWSFAPLGVIALCWWGLSRTPFLGQLMAVGSDDRAAYTAGVNVTGVRFLAYVIGGLLVGAAAMMLTALIGSADPKVGTNYTMIAIAAVALGGVSLAGGRGGLIGAAIGAIDIFLLQSLLTAFNVSTYVLQVAYGAVLVLAVVLMALQDRPTKRSHA
ncbi:ABC transporter permease [Xinfangfangia sp. D13-10-4-6]|nr:ABC transporter permease [Pseudogemmobacter hezensis]